MHRAVFLFLTAFLGFLISGLGHALIELVYLGWALLQHRPVAWHAYVGGRFPCALPPVLFYGLPVLGLIGAVLMGNNWRFDGDREHR